MCARGKGGTRKVCDSPFLPLLILLLPGFIHLHTVINQGNPVTLSNVSFLQRFFFLIPPSSLFGVTQIHINKYSGRTHRHPSSTKSASSQNHQTWISLTRISSSSHPSPDPNSHRKPQDGDEAEVLLGWAGSTGAVLCLHWWEVWGHVLSCVWSVCPCAEAMFLENSLASPGTALPRLLVTLRHAVSGNGDKDGSFGALIPRALLQNSSTSGCAQLLSPAASSCFFPEPGNPLTFRGVRGVEPCCQLALCPRSCGKRQPGDRPCPVQDPGSAVLGWGMQGAGMGPGRGHAGLTKPSHVPTDPSVPPQPGCGAVEGEGTAGAVVLQCPMCHELGRSQPLPPACDLPTEGDNAGANIWERPRASGFA